VSRRLPSRLSRRASRARSSVHLDDFQVGSGHPIEWCPVGPSVPDEIQARFANAGLSLTGQEAGLLLSYFGLLTKWNKTINLTALALDPPTPQTLDRLLVEPFVAAGIARCVLASRDAVSAGQSLRLLDVGSGGGSPAVPLTIGLGSQASGGGPAVELSMVESKGRKAAFLRELIRDLPLEGASVHQSRLEELQPQQFDLVSIRAVRADGDLWEALADFVRPSGLVLWFRTAGDPSQDVWFAPMLELDSLHPLIPGTSSELAILRRPSA
jgi:16S rRNA (guanine527-N7)-methyltransferase